MEARTMKEVMKDKNDCTIVEAVKVFFDLEADPPITTKYDIDNGYRDEHGWYEQWYKNQKEHVIAWFIAQPTTGIDGKRNPNYSSFVTYENLKSSGAILWIAEALGVDDTLIRAAVLQEKIAVEK